jgi:two-component system, cell cycle response regulator CpdR
MVPIVLVVDDEPLVLKATAEMLKNLGCEVLTADNGIGALARLSDHERIATLITDVNMRGMNGFELAERARRFRKGLQVILLSGAASAGRGFPFIRKPFTEDDLMRTMRSTSGSF